MMNWSGLRSSEMADPTITVSSLGDRGVEALYGVIYPPQVAIVGFGKVVDRNTVDVDGKQIKTKNIILAMGSVPKDLPHIKADGKLIINSDHILQIDRIPKSMLVIGAGAVGCEFASIFSRFGTKTTIVEVMPQLLPIEDEEIAKEFTRIFKKKGIEVYTDAKVLSCEVTANGVKSTRPTVSAGFPTIAKQRRRVSPEISARPVTSPASPGTNGE